MGFWMFCCVCQSCGVGRVVVLIICLMRWYVLRCFVYYLCSLRGKKLPWFLVCVRSSGGEGLCTFMLHIH